MLSKDNNDFNLSENEIFDKFKRLMIVNTLHNKNSKIDFNNNKDDEDQMAKAEFYNFMSIIIKPEEETNFLKYFYMIFENFDFNLLFSFFNKEDGEDKNINMDIIMKLKKILEEVFLKEK
jgi:hypothetical protein